MTLKETIETTLTQFADDYSRMGKLSKSKKRSILAQRIVASVAEHVERIVSEVEQEEDDPMAWMIVKTLLLREAEPEIVITHREMVAADAMALRMESTEQGIKVRAE